MTSEHGQAAGAAESDRYRSLLSGEVCSMRYDNDRRLVQSAPSLIGMQAGLVDVLQFTAYGEQWCSRDPDLIRANPADYYILCSPLSGLLTVNQGRFSVELHPGCFCILSSSLPFDGHACPDSADGFLSSSHVRVPGGLLRQRVPNMDELCGSELQATSGRGRVILSLLEAILEDGDCLAAGERDRIGALLLEAIGEVSLEAADGLLPQLERPSAHKRTLDRAVAYITSRLSDPDLGPAQIAQHCGVSTRFLYTSFSACSRLSVAELIRESRLQACRAALRNVSLEYKTITEVAGDYGFDDPSHFGRVYRARFGITPRQERSSKSREVQWAGPG